MSEHLRCSSHVDVYTIKSSKYALQLCNPERTVLTNHWKVAGALHILKAITLFCKKQLGVTNAENSEARSVSGTCQYPLSKSNLLTSLWCRVCQHYLPFVEEGISVGNSHRINFSKISNKTRRTVRFLPPLGMAGIGSNASALSPTLKRRETAEQS